MLKNFNQFLTEVDAVGSGELAGTKPTALSEAVCEKINQCMEMIKMEAHHWHNDDNPEHTFESYMMECDKYMKEMMSTIQM